MRRRLKAIIALECLALLLALLHVPGGVLTDEAKYLLSIPYPHPPLLRAMIEATKSIPGHALLWRFIFASALVQAVWIIWDLGGTLTREKRIALVTAWIFSSALLLEAGSILLTIPVAIAGLLFIRLSLSPQAPSEKSLPLIALLWLAALFFAYQSLLYSPIVLAVMWRTRGPKRNILLFFGVPILLLALYTLTNPHALATMIKVTGQDAALPIHTRTLQVFWIWLLAGSGIGSLYGTWGLLRSQRVDLLATTFLLLAYIALTSQQYYDLLLTPLLVAGCYQLFMQRKLSAPVFSKLQCVCGIILAFLFLPSMTPTDAHATMKRLKTHGLDGPILIDGPFGHEWQYESPVPVLRFSQELSTAAEESASALVCTKRTCEEDIDQEKWTRFDTVPVEIWVRKSGSNS